MTLKCTLLEIHTSSCNNFLVNVFLLIRNVYYNDDVYDDVVMRYYNNKYFYTMTSVILLQHPRNTILYTNLALCLKWC